jgi:hypothetical protein
MSNCDKVETSTFIIISAERSRFSELTQFLQTMSRLVCDTQYGSAKDALSPFNNSPIHGFSQQGVVTCCGNRWRHCFVTSLHRWWTEKAGSTLRSVNIPHILEVIRPGKSWTSLSSATARIRPLYLF